MRDPLNKTITTIQPSGIRKFFDVVHEMKDAISLGVGEPDFDTPWHIRDEGIYSLEKGKSFWGDELPYLCHSWLLYPGLKEVLSQTSNILQFQNYFQIVDIDFADQEAEWRIFGKVEENPEKYPENTTLQKRAKQYLLSGKKLGNGLGVLQEL